MMTRVLVTGADGQLGQTIKALYKGHKAMDFVFVSRAELDITDPKQLNAFFNQQRFDYCINCAAYTNVEQAERTPDIAFKVNAEGVKNLAQNCAAHAVILIHISTDYVFDGRKNQPYTIHDTPNPINAYGRSKLLGEQYIQQYLTTYYIVRTSWLYSKIYGQNFYRFILDSAKQGRPLTITTDQVGCPTDTEDLASFLMAHIIETKPPFGLYHFSHSKPMTWFDFAQRILEEQQLTDQVELHPVNTYKTLARRPKYSVLAAT
ncbi:dTDP-4-dehydrorhamnose reductase [Aestuariivivens sediminis]|uniref:dTDP-4-dehydrorhamnose reductase n=1 Tax=Aestuariivivens sediminis TaxID=2913557 RepID=UPI001F5AFDB6|nr:dTDP-4-dehydrorhamnose reductase [Aestuariivivens sediminis]